MKDYYILVLIIIGLNIFALQTMGTDNIEINRVVYNNANKSPQAASEISNVSLTVRGYNQYNFTSQLNITQSESMNFTLTIRSNSTKIEDYNTTTNSDGVGIWLLNRTLKLCEYQLNVVVAGGTNTTYYQTRYCNERDYAQDQLNDSWDFSEDHDNWITHSTASFNVVNGYLNVSAVGTFDGVKILFDDTTPTYYTKLYVRMNIILNPSAIIFYTYLNNVNQEISYITEVYDWNIYEMNITKELDEIRISNANNPAGESFHIDWVSFYHNLDISFYQTVNMKYYWLNSENSSLTYDTYLISTSETTQSNMVDLTNCELEFNGFYTLNYSVIADSIYPNSLFLPSDTWQQDFSMTIPNNDVEIHELVEQSYDTFMVLGLITVAFVFVFQISYIIFFKRK